MKILVSAYACEPGKGSEPEVGWQWARQIARYHETWVITRSNNQPIIEAALGETSNGNLRFVYVDLPKWARFWKRGHRGVHVYYLLWQIIAFFRAISLHRTHAFHIVHHITFVNMYIGPLLCFLGPKFVWGPIGANPQLPPKFGLYLGSSASFDNYMRSVFRKTSECLDIVRRIAVRKARRLIAINSEIKSRLSPIEQLKTVVIPQNAIDHAELSPNSRSRGAGPLAILTVGNFVSIKGFPLAIKAFARHLNEQPRSHLSIVGNGTLNSHLNQLVHNLNIISSVTFRGFLPRARVLETMAASDVFLFPSFEGAGMVVIEAMAKGLPVVCLDFGGPGEYVTEECGIKVALTSPEEVIDGLAAALNRLATDPALYERLSAGAIRRVREHYLWDHIGDRLNALYHEVLSEA